MKIYKAAVYHYTYGEPDNPYCKNDISRLKHLAVILGYDDIDTYCDNRTTSEEHEEFDKMLANIDTYDALFVTTYTHINKYTGRALEIAHTLNQKGIKIYSLHQAPLIFGESPDFDHPLKVATYYCHWGRHLDIDNQSIKNDILKLYIDKKTAWTLTGQYSDTAKKGRAGKQLQFEQMITDKDNIDLILVHSFASIHWRTTDFFQYKDLLYKDILSLQEGLLRKEHMAW